MSSADSPPSIRVYESHRYTLPHHRRPPAPTTALAMAIPRAREPIPPPLPPPRHIQDLHHSQDPGWQWGHTNSPRDTGFNASRLAAVRPGSSLYGSTVHTSSTVSAASSSSSSSSAALQQTATTHPPPPPYPRRPSVDFAPTNPRETTASWDDLSSENSGEHHSDEDRKRKPRPTLGNYRFTSERQLGQRELQSSSHAYDKQLLSKIGGPNTPTRNNAPPSVPASSTSASANGQDSTPESHTSLHKLNGQLKPLAVPDRLPSLSDPASNWPVPGAISPDYSGFRSPVFDSGSVESHRGRFGSVSMSGTLDEAAAQHRSSYDHTVFSDHELGVEESGLRELNISDRSPVESDEYQSGSRGSLKRRASSPPTEATREDRPITSSHNDLYHRRSAQMLVNRNGVSSRFQGNSLSSTGSGGQRIGSMGSSYGLSTTASSMTSYGADQRLSPSALSPLGETDSGPVSPYTVARSLDPSPRASLSRPQPHHHHRALSESEHGKIRKLSAEGMLLSRQNSVASRIPGAYICECCPKKPKKFDSEEDLRQHELEKQYICQYCPNRFKNKNEAERHQNSLHLRLHSWSCATLTAVQATFHPSSTRPDAVDICGYCGDEFPNPADWEVRSDHLSHVHKFGECNQAKKFFRADHFRQHLKHSHAGTSGKWTNMLEIACMRDESQTTEVIVSTRPTSATTGPAAPPPKPGVINEVHDEI